MPTASIRSNWHVAGACTFYGKSNIRHHAKYVLDNASSDTSIFWQRLRGLLLCHAFGQYSKLSCKMHCLQVRYVKGLDLSPNEIDEARRRYEELLTRKASMLDRSLYLCPPAWEDVMSLQRKHACSAAKSTSQQSAGSL